MRPSSINHPLCCANCTTAPSDGRKRRFFVDEIGKDGYAVSEDEAISERIWLTKIYS